MSDEVQQQTRSLPSPSSNALKRLAQWHDRTDGMLPQAAWCDLLEVVLHIEREITSKQEAMSILDNDHLECEAKQRASQARIAELDQKVVDAEYWGWDNAAVFDDASQAAIKVASVDDEAFVDIFWRYLRQERTAREASND